MAEGKPTPTAAPDLACLLAKLRRGLTLTEMEGLCLAGVVDDLLLRYERMRVLTDRYSNSLTRIGMTVSEEVTGARREA